MRFFRRTRLHPRNRPVAQTGYSGAMSNLIDQSFNLDNVRYRIVDVLEVGPQIIVYAVDLDDPDAMKVAFHLPDIRDALDAASAA